MTLEVTDNQ